MFAPHRPPLPDAQHPITAIQCPPIPTRIGNASLRRSRCDGMMFGHHRGAPKAAEGDDGGMGGSGKASQFENTPGSKGDLGMGEDVLGRLRVAEEEAAKLREELAAVRGEKPDIVKPRFLYEQVVLACEQDSKEAASPTGSTQGEARKRRGAPELVYDAERPNWFSETDMEFLVGSNANETNSSYNLSVEEQDVIKRRLLLAGGLTAVVAAAALIPPDLIQFKPSGPLSSYILPLLRSRALLGEAQEYIENADWQQVRLILDRIKGPPNNTKENLFAASSLLDSRATQQRAEQLAKDFLDNLEAIDYNKYFEDRSRSPDQGGAAQQRFVNFSLQALKATTSNLDAFLRLMPSTALEEARQELESVYN